MKVELTKEEAQVILDALSESNVGRLPLSKNLREKIHSIRKKLSPEKEVRVMGAEAAFFVELKDSVRRPEHAFAEIKRIIENITLVEFVDMEVR